MSYDFRQDAELRIARSELEKQVGDLNFFMTWQKASPDQIALVADLVAKRAHQLVQMEKQARQTQLHLEGLERQQTATQMLLAVR